MRYFWHFLRNYKKETTVLFFFVMLNTAAESIGLGMLLPFFQTVFSASLPQEKASVFLKPFLDFFPAEHQIYIIGGGILALLIFKSLFTLVQTAYAAHFEWRVLREWSTGIMERYMRSPYSFVISRTQGLLLNNVIAEPPNAIKFIEVALLLTSRLLLMLGLYLILFLVHWQMTVAISIIAIIIVMLVYRITRTIATTYGTIKLQWNQQLHANAAENISAVRQIKTFSLEERVCKRFGGILANISKLVIRFKIIQVFPDMLAEIPIAFFSIGAIIYLFTSQGPKALSYVPTIALFAVIGLRLFSCASIIIKNRLLFFSLLASLKVIFENTTRKAEFEILDKGISVGNLETDIVVENLSFSYGARKALFNNLNMRIPFQKATAIIGGSGSGKSTFADLLIGLYQPDAGKILINHQDLQTLQLSSWRKQVGFVSQDTLLFHASIRENILAGKPEASDEEVIAAAKKARAHEFIQHFPRGYETIVGDRGLALSGGQRQRIAIARAMIRNPHFFIFDEATSSLDYETEKLIQQTIMSFAEEKTVLIITHRLLSIANVELIYRLENGIIVQSGTAKEIFKQGFSD